MVVQIIGKYLIERGIITKGQMLVLNKERRKSRASLGLVAISQGFMSADEVKAIVAESGVDGGLSDRAFAEAVQEMGYLTAGQISSLAYKQGDSYLSFVQALEKMNIIDIEALEKALLDFALIDNAVQLDDLKSNDANRIIPLYIPAEAGKYINAAIAAVHYLEQKVDPNIYPVEAAFITDKFSAASGIYQFAKGEKEYTYALVAKGPELAELATSYTRERYDEVDEEVLEVVSEIIGRISANYATELSQDSVVIDLTPPQPYGEPHEIVTDEMLILPLSLKYDVFYLLISMSHEFEIY